MTFDDGPGVYTSTHLDTLEQYGAQATFFMHGSNVEKYGADVIPRMAAIG
ncbi:polysaccharide deacetylase family protein [Fusicatenibacter saccharivorans]|nr:polysaccharide deacetylase family protein [Fusicatenibacter saccharivorans]MCC2736011.1 polysaccharide deacetylase family protein [Fusicatenibacter saccharivorans]